MKLTLAKIKRHPDMDQETDCFSAVILFDGKPIGTVSNLGQGGPNEYTWRDDKVGATVNKWAEQQNPDGFEQLDQIIDDLLCDAEERKQLKRWCKRQTLFRLFGDAKGEWRTVKAPFDAKVKAWLVAKYGDNLERIANESI
jgi:hypothetical protein